MRSKKNVWGPYEEEVPVGAAQGDVHPFYVNCDGKVRPWDVISATVREATLRIQLPLKTKITENHKKYSYILWWENEALTRSSHTWNELLPKFSVKETNFCCYLSQQFCQLSPTVSQLTECRLFHFPTKNLRIKEAKLCVWPHSRYLKSNLSHPKSMLLQLSFDPSQT